MIIIKDFSNCYKRGILSINEKKINWTSVLKTLCYRILNKTYNEAINGLFGCIGKTPAIFYANNHKLCLIIQDAILELNDSIDVLLTNEGDGKARFCIYEINGKKLIDINYSVVKPFLIEYDTITQIDLMDYDFGIFIYTKIKTEKDKLSLINAWSK
jgi:hypothetical protein